MERPVRCIIRGEGATTRGIVGHTVNATLRGLQLFLSEELAPGTVFRLQLGLPNVAVIAEAEVVWSQESPIQEASPHEGITSYPHGLQFTSLELQDRLTSELFIAKGFGG